VISHLTRFVSGLWQIHAFGEGNTRTTAVFTILYLRSLGFNVENNSLIIALIKVIGNDEFSVSQLMEKTGLKHRPNFIEYHLNPAIARGFY
jgi:fido (protein-threonine AMPylation protein)